MIPSPFDPNRRKMNRVLLIKHTKALQKKSEALDVKDNDRKEES